MSGYWNITRIISLIVIIILVILIIYVLMSGNNKSTNNSTQNSILSHQSSSKTPYILYYFYSVHCPACTNFVPIWNQVVEKLGKIKNLTTRPVDVSRPENENLAFYYNVTYTPTIILVTPNKTLEYSGNRTVSDIYNFVMNNISN
jgi:thiol-disulfide isomerase/thioredoxin